MRKYFPMVAILVLIPTLLTQAQAPSYKTYSNARFGYSISYPANLLTPQGEATNGDGQKFLSNDGNVELIVYGSNNALDQSLKEMYDEARSAGNMEVTYQVFKPGWFVVSGLSEGKVFYQKTILSKGVIKTFRLQYDQNVKRTWDPITSKIAASFKG